MAAGRDLSGELFDTAPPPGGRDLSAELELSPATTPPGAYQPAVGAGATHDIEVIARVPSGMQQTERGLAMPAQTVGLVGLLARTPPTKAELQEQGGMLVGEATGNAVLPGVGGAAGAMTGQALTRYYETGEFPSWRELGITGAQALAVPMLKGLGTAAKSVLGWTRAGKLWQRNQALEQYKTAETAAQGDLAAVEAEYGPTLADLDAQQTQLKDFTRDYNEAVQERLRVGRLETQADLTMAKTTADDDLKALHLAADEERALGLAHRDALQETQQRAVNLAKATATETPKSLATTARTWLHKFDLPDEEAVKDQFTAMRQHKFVMPSDLLEEAQGTIRQEVDTIKQFFPQASLGEMERLAVKPPQAARPPAAPVEPVQPGVGARVRLPDTEIELQQFIRRQKGIRATGEELHGELRDLTSPKATGTTGLLNNKSGLTLQEMAERAQQAGFIHGADKAELLEALDRSVRGKGAYSRHNQRLAAELGDFADAEGTLTVPHDMSFQQAHTLLKWLGKRVGTLERSGDLEQLGPVKLYYQKIQQTIDRAVTQGDLPADVRAELATANAAYKVLRTHDALTDAVERYITKGKFDPDGLADYLRKNTEGGFLRQRLFETGMLDETEAALRDWGQQIRQAQERVGTVRQDFLGQRRVLGRLQREQRTAAEAGRQAIQDRLRTEQMEIDARQVQTQGDLLAEQRRVTEETRTRLAALEDVAAGTREQFKTRQAAITGPLEAQKAAIPPPVTTPDLVDIALGGVAPVLLSRALMSGWAQRQFVGRLLSANMGVLDDRLLRLIGSTTLRTTTTGKDH